MDIQELLDAARAGSLRAAGRLLSLVESERRDEVLAVLPAAPVRTTNNNRARTVPSSTVKPTAAQPAAAAKN